MMEAKVVDIEEALSWIMFRGERDLCVESDSLLAVQAINGQVNYQLEVGHIIEACILKLTSRNGIRVRHIKRLTNRATHTMARIPCELNYCVNFMFRHVLCWIR